MYEYIDGILQELESGFAIIEVASVGYRLHIPHSYQANKQHHVGQKVRFYITFLIRELSQTFYGFLTRQERALFELLLTISGIGPKTSLAIVGHLGAEMLFQAVANQNILTLCKVPGIGKKSAERLIVELKNKIDKMPLESSTITVGSSLEMDAQSALMNLGYNGSVAQKAVKRAIETLPEGFTLTEIITQALKLKP